MKRFAPLIFLIAVFLIGLLVGKSSPSHPTKSPSVPRRESVNPSPKPGEYRVARVLDGDTIELEHGERVRYLSRLQAAEDRARGATRGLWTPRP